MFYCAKQCKLVHLWKISFNKWFAIGSGSGSEIRRKSPDPDPAPEKWFGSFGSGSGSSTLVRNNWDVKCTGTGLLFNRWSGSRIRIPDPNPGSESRYRGKKEVSPKKMQNWSFLKKIIIQSFAMHVPAHLLYNICPVSGSVSLHTDPYPAFIIRIRIHITVFNKGVYF